MYSSTKKFKTQERYYKMIMVDKTKTFWKPTKFMGSIFIMQLQRIAKGNRVLARLRPMSFFWTLPDSDLDHNQPHFCHSNLSFTIWMS